ncbi:MAG: hypothetical protein M0R75_07270 [Dehalococcoidia bacterium]|nr:hypothetical protein [Dehalococcoidia bacterium]
MYWNADLKCRKCGYQQAEKPIDAETEEAAKIMAFDCSNCGTASALEVVPSSLRTRFVV